MSEIIDKKKLKKQENTSIIKYLSRIFSSGNAAVRRKVKDPQWVEQTKMGAYFKDRFSVHRYDVLNSAGIWGFYAVDRMTRYYDFMEMENTPEISAVLDLYAREISSPDENGAVFHITSKDSKKREILETLFFDTLSIDSKLPLWVRELSKFGDFAAYNDIDPEYGVVNMIPIPAMSFERIEGGDPEHPHRIKYVISGQSMQPDVYQYMVGGQNMLQGFANNEAGFQSVKNMFNYKDENKLDINPDGSGVLPPWMLTHFRNVLRVDYLPYGTSILEGSRRAWRLLTQAEDSMLTQRLVRGSDKLTYYIDTSLVPADQRKEYMEGIINSLRREPMVSMENGQVNFRWNPGSIMEDIFIPVAGKDSATKVDKLPGSDSQTLIEDVKYLRDKLMMSLKVPGSYVNYSQEGKIPDRNLSQSDIRFANDIQRIQRIIITELRKVAMIQLAFHGFRGEDLLDFDISMNNPSTASQEQRLKVLKNKTDLAQSMLGLADGKIFDRAFIRENIFALSPEEIARIKTGRIDDAREDATVAEVNADDEGEGGGGGPEGLFASNERKSWIDNLLGETDYLPADDKFAQLDDPLEDELDDLLDMSILGGQPHVVEHHEDDNFEPNEALFGKNVSEPYEHMPPIRQQISVGQLATRKKDDRFIDPDLGAISQDSSYDLNVYQDAPQFETLLDDLPIRPDFTSLTPFREEVNTPLKTVVIKSTTKKGGRE